MREFNLKPSQVAVKAYYQALENLRNFGHGTEGNVRGAFSAVLNKCAQTTGLTLVEEYHFEPEGRQSSAGKPHKLRADGVLKDAFDNVLGYWEAKDDRDDLLAEAEKKFALGYPRTNILFQSPSRALLYQDGHYVEIEKDITQPENLVEVLRLFFEFRQAPIRNWEHAVDRFAEKIPQYAKSALEILERERARNARFRDSFSAFAELCRQSINPELKDEAVEEMLVQHLLTERIFRKVFNNPEFTRRNVIAAEIEKVISTITDKHFSRDTFLLSLDHFYKALEEAAAAKTDYAEKQAFLNRVYERFFQGFSQKQADTHGIVYTPQPIVDFMVRSVEEVLQAEFGKSLSDSGVHILDPFTGTGNFITRIMQQIKKTKLPDKFAGELHCNEIMLLPYYIASMNIEHEYMERAGEYKTFEGICLVDTFELAEPRQGGLFTTENTERVKKQKAATITVVIGNPPYNMGQANENDQNKNRKYPELDKRIAHTYTHDSKATLRNKLSDPYVKAFRWASDRIGKQGIVCFVSNNSFIDQIAFDGMRRHLSQDFSKVFVLDLGGNVRKNPKLSGTTHNVFGIQVGVAITLLVKEKSHQPGKPAGIFYARMPEDWRKGAKYIQLDTWKSTAGLEWKPVQPDLRHTWLTEGQQDDFASLMPLGDKATKGTEDTSSLFRVFSLGVASNRDAWVYNSSAKEVEKNIRLLIRNYQIEMASHHAPNVESAVGPDRDGRAIKWTDRLLDSFLAAKSIVYSAKKLRRAAYRPFASRAMYFDHLLNQRRYQQHRIMPVSESEMENRSICWNVSAGLNEQACLATNLIPDLHYVGDSQCFPFYTYDEDGTNRQENITDWALEQYRKHYKSKTVTKWDIFHATYALLHHPEYRARYAANLKRELPRIPFPPEFGAFAAAGKRLMELHIDYEKQPEHKLEWAESAGQTLDLRVEKMKLSPDKTELVYNRFLTLRGIPLEVYKYRLGNRSAIEWVVDQYRVSTDKRSGIVNDPNRPDDPEYILRLIGQVIAVSLETVQIVAALPSLDFDSKET